MKYPLIAIEDESFLTAEPQYFYRNKLTHTIKKFEQYCLPHTYCDSEGNCFRISEYRESNEPPSTGCNPIYWFRTYKVIELEFSEIDRRVSEIELRAILKRNAEKLHFVKSADDKNELFDDLEKANTHREIIECVCAAEWIDEENENLQNTK